MNYEPDNYATSQPAVNPATGLPMLEEAWVDIGGNPFGCNINQPGWTSPAQNSWGSDIGNLQGCC